MMTRHSGGTVAAQAPSFGAWFLASTQTTVMALPRQSGGSAMKAYTVEGPFGDDDNLRVTHTGQDDRVATCYEPGNAQFICDALNQFDPDGEKYNQMIKHESAKALVRAVKP
jgi:hypothetical protein